MSIVEPSITGMSMNKIALSIRVSVDDWTDEKGPLVNLFSVKQGILKIVYSLVYCEPLWSDLRLLSKRGNSRYEKSKSFRSFILFCSLL